MNETAVDVINELMKNLIPVLIKRYIPLEIFEQTHHDIFEIILDSLLTSGIIKDKPTQHLVFDAMLNSAGSDDHIELLIKWFQSGVVSNSEGTELSDIEISLKHKHTIMRRIWTSASVDLDRKKSLMA